GRALAQTIGTAVIRLADADVVPIEFTGLADTIQKYSRELKDLLSKKQDDVRERNRQIADGVFAAMRDPRTPAPIPKVETVPPAVVPPPGVRAWVLHGLRREDGARSARRDRGWPVR